MRKRSIKCFFEGAYWLILFVFPILVYLVFAHHHDLVTFGQFLDSSLGFSFATDNVFLTALTDVFGEGGIIPLFANAGSLIQILAYYCTVTFVRVFIEVILFIPRWCSHLMGGYFDD